MLPGPLSGGQAKTRSGAATKATKRYAAIRERGTRSGDDIYMKIEGNIIRFII